MLEVDIKKKMDRFSLEVCFEAGRETVALLGASGSGKSMTLKCIAGIETPDEGRIVLDGRVLFDSEKKINLSPRERRVGYLFQQYALFPNMTVEENIRTVIRKSGNDKNVLVKKYIQDFFLEGLEGKKPGQLSGGQQQRVALARIIASEAQMIMLDEPFSALDSFLRWKLEKEIKNVIEEYPRTVLYVSHNRNEVYRVSDRVGILHEGKIQSLREKKSLFFQPDTIPAALLTGCRNFSKILKVNDKKILALDWLMELDTKEPVGEDVDYIGISAGNIKVAEPQEEINCMECKVVEVIDNHVNVIVILAPAVEGKQSLRHQLRMEIDRKKWKEIRGDRIRVSIHEEDILLLSNCEKSIYEFEKEVKY